MVEHFTCNEKVRGSTPRVGFDQSFSSKIHMSLSLQELVHVSRGENDATIVHLQSEDTIAALMHQPVYE